MRKGNKLFFWTSWQLDRGIYDVQNTMVFGGVTAGERGMIKMHNIYPCKLMKINKHFTYDRKSLCVECLQQIQLCSLEYPTGSSYT